MNLDLRDTQDSKVPLSSCLALASNQHDFRPLRYLGSLPLDAEDQPGAGVSSLRPHAPLASGESAPRRAHDLVALDLFEFPA